MVKKYGTPTLGDPIISHHVMWDLEKAKYCL